VPESATARIFNLLDVELSGRSGVQLAMMLSFCQR